jgi:hypothetical protein
MFSTIKEKFRMREYFIFFVAVSVYLDESVEEFSPAKEKELPHNSQL